MRVFALRVSSSSESSTAGRRELVEAVLGEISGPRVVDSDELWRAVRETRGGIEPDEDISGCIEYTSTLDKSPTRRRCGEDQDQ